MERAALALRLALAACPGSGRTSFDLLLKTTERESKTSLFFCSGTARSAVGTSRVPRAGEVVPTDHPELQAEKSSPPPQLRVMAGQRMLCVCSCHRAASLQAPLAAASPCSFFFFHVSWEQRWTPGRMRCCWQGTWERKSKQSPKCEGFFFSHAFAFPAPAVLLLSGKQRVSWEPQDEGKLLRAEMVAAGAGGSTPRRTGARARRMLPWEEELLCMDLPNTLLLLPLSPLRLCRTQGSSFRSSFPAEASPPAPPASSSGIFVGINRLVWKPSPWVEHLR